MVSITPGDEKGGEISPPPVGPDLPVVGFPFGLGEEKPVLLGPLDDRRNGGLMTILVPEPVSDIAIVIGPERNLGGFD
jgi:hypothetical protein